MDDAAPFVELRYGDSRLTLTRIEKLPPDDPGAGDMEVLVRIESRGFTGENRVWIGAEEWSRFLAQLRELEAHRNGEVAINAMSPGEFELTVRAVDKAGHIGVFGSLARFLVAFTDYTHSVRFAFEVCPSLLPRFLSDCESLALD